MATTVNGNATGGGSGVSLTSAQTAAGATGVIASDSSGNAFKQDGTAFAGGGGAAWGGITGTLSAQTDLQTALNGKLATTAIASTTALLAGDGAGNAVAASSTVYGQPVIGVINQPFGIAPSGATIGASGGALTLTTAFIETYGPTGGTPFDGIWLWFAAGDTDTGSLAGFYWTVMTSTTAGTVNSNFLTPGSTALNKPPASVTPYTTNVGKVGTAGTTAQIQGYIFPNMAAGFLGANGFMELATSQRSNVSAGSKQLQPKLVINSAALGNIGPATQSTASSSNIETTMRVYNKNNASRQGSGYVSTTSTSVVTSAPAGLAGTTGTNTCTMGIDLKLATATDWVVCQFGALRAWPAA